MTKRATARFLFALGAMFAVAGPAGNALAQRPAHRVTHAVHNAAGPPQGVVHAFQPGDPLMDAHGDPAIVPAQYYGDPSFGGPMNGAYGDVGYSVDQVGPHYFDVALEYVALRRAELFTDSVAFTSLGAAGVGGAAPNIVLSSDALDTQFESGFRVTGRYDVGPLSFLEASYTGIYDMSTQASVSSTATSSFGLGNLFSPFTNFGAGFGLQGSPDPLAGGFNATNLEDFEETDRATSHSILFTSDLQTAELNFRRYWVGYNPRVSGTLLAGFRYTKLNESFRFDTVGNNFVQVLSKPTDPNSPTVPPTSSNVDPSASPEAGGSTYRLLADNDLAGFQAGGDVWIGVIQGLRIGAETKMGIFANNYELEDSFTTTDGGPEAFANITNNSHPAFIGEWRVMMVADIWPNMSFRGGYEALLLSSLATVGQNFNSGSPYEFTTVVPGGSDTVVPPRQAFIRDQETAFFHGFNCGFEYIW